VLLHGWPGDRADYREVSLLLDEHADVVVPDLRGFGGSDKHREDPSEAYSAAGQARSVLGLIEELGLESPVIGGYDIGSRVAQTIARERPELVRALVLCPPLPGVGERVLGPQPQREFWYQSFHRLALAEDLIDGDTDAARAYLSHFWNHWSGPGYTPDDAELDRLAERYGAPGAFVASVGWYRAGSGTVARALSETAPEPAERIAAPTTVLWPEFDPLFPEEWSNRLDEFFSNLSLRRLPGVGHFVPLEAPQDFAGAVVTALR
jgi:pimeloyl-ACP methyl ester carboxylesterase